MRLSSAPALRFAPPLQAAAVIVAALAAYVGALNNGLIYDDVALLLENPWIRSWDALGEAFRQPLFAFHEYASERDPSAGYYRPLAHVVFWLHRALFGTRAWGYHAGLIVAHALVSAGVWRLLRRTLQEPGVSAPAADCAAIFGALLFALHPVHTEAVAWVSGWMDVGMCGGLVLAVLLLDPARATPLRSALAGLSWLAALLFKETGLILPLLLACLYRDAVLPARARLRLYAPLAVSLGVYLALRVQALGLSVPGGGAAAGALHWLDMWGLVTDLGSRLLWPAPLLVVSPHGPAHSLWEARCMAGLGVVCAGAALALFSFRRSPAVFTGLAWLALPLVPVALLQLRGVDAYAERYLYLPSVGFVLLVGVALRALLARRRVPPALVLAACAGILLAAGAATALRVRAWHDDITLWEDTVAKAPHSAVARARLGAAYLKARRPLEAQQQLQLALQTLQGSSQVHSDLGIAYAMTGRMPEAVQALQRAEQLAPGSAAIQHNLGLALRRMGQLPEAIERFRRASQLAPTRSDSLFELGRSLLQAGRPAEALEPLTRAHQLAPGFEPARRSLEQARQAARAVTPP